METIPVFFAADDAYAPFLAVALSSMLENASPDYFYNIHVMTSGLTEENSDKLKRLEGGNSRIYFEDMVRPLERIAKKLHLRDYFSITTYYRLFIAKLFPQYDRALYFDADTVFLSDVSKLYHTDLDGAVVGAVQEDVMAMERVFGEYVERVLDIPVPQYFNAGVLVIDLEKYRAENMLERFVTLLRSVRYELTQDQDYLNAVCRNRVKLLGFEWNKSPSDAVSGYVPCPNIIHYKLNWKPWKYDGLKYGDIFWEYADKSEFGKVIRDRKNAFTNADALRDNEMYERLKRIAVGEAI